MEKELASAIKQYRIKVDEVCILMLRGLGVNTKEQLVNYSKQLGEFELEGTNHYFFHGIGCRFWNSTIKIDWDFGEGGQWCCIDPWKLYCFIKDNSVLETELSLEQIKIGLEKAVDNKEFVKKWDRYYFLDA